MLSTFYLCVLFLILLVKFIRADEDEFFLAPSRNFPSPLERQRSFRITDIRDRNGFFPSSPPSHTATNPPRLRRTMSNGYGMVISQQQQLQQPPVSPIVARRNLSLPSSQHHRALERQRSHGSNPRLALQELNKGLKNLFPGHKSGDGLLLSPSSAAHHDLRRTHSRSSLLDASHDEEIITPSSVDVYHTVHGGRKKPLLASRKAEPFSKIVRRQASEKDRDMPRIREQHSNNASTDMIAPSPDYVLSANGRYFGYHESVRALLDAHGLQKEGKARSREPLS